MESFLELASRCLATWLLTLHPTHPRAQALSNVPPLRNYFLEEDNYKSIQRPPGDIMFLLVQRFGELMRKLWNPRNFKAHVSPHEMLQAVVLCSKKNFQITKQGWGELRQMWLGRGGWGMAVARRGQVVWERSQCYPRPLDWEISGLLRGGILQGPAMLPN